MGLNENKAVFLDWVSNGYHKKYFFVLKFFSPAGNSNTDPPDNTLGTKLRAKRFYGFPEKTDLNPSFFKGFCYLAFLKVLLISQTVNI